METEQFVKNFYQEKQNTMALYFNEKSETKVQSLIKAMQLTKNQIEIIKEVLDTALTDTMYTILLGLEGSTSIGDIQENYKIQDEKGNELNDGEIGSYAYEYFHEIQQK